MTVSAMETGRFFSEVMDREKFTSNVKEDADLKQAARDFESLFIHKMLQTMRKTIPENSLLDGGLVEDIYTDMLDQQIARAAAERESLGIAAMIYEQMSHTGMGGKR
jgi:flagellar protein FlgJ